MRKHALASLKTAVLEKPLPRRQARDRQACAHLEIDVARQWREIARLDGNIFSERAIAVPIGKAEYTLSHRQSRRAVA
jgi:hypothetical protein